MRRALLLTLAACSGPSTNGAGPASGSAEPVAPASTCVTPSREADPATSHYPPKADTISIAGDVVKLCWGDKRPQRTCWRADVAKKVFEAQPVTSDAPDQKVPIFARPPRAKAEVRDDGSIRLCGPGGSPCKPFANPGPTDHPTFVGVSDDLSLVAIPDGDTLRIYDVASARVRTTIKAWPSEMPGFHSEPHFVGDRLVVWYGASPVSEQGRIFDLAGKELAIVGGKDFAVIEPPFYSWRIHGTEWAFKDEANRLVLVDIKDPKVTSTHDMKPLLVESPRPSEGNDFHIADVLAVAGTADRLIIVTGENPFTIGVLDRRSGKLQKLEPPRCPG